MRKTDLTKQLKGLTSDLIYFVQVAKSSYNVDYRKTVKELISEAFTDSYWEEKYDKEDRST